MCISTVAAVANGIVMEPNERGVKTEGLTALLPSRQMEIFLRQLNCKRLIGLGGAVPETQRKRTARLLFVFLLTSVRRVLNIQTFFHLEA